MLEVPQRVGVLLEADVAARHLEARRFLLAQRSASIAAALAQRYAAAGGDEARREAAWSLAILGDFFQKRSERARAETLFGRAIALDEEPAALLGLATLLSKTGRVDEAVPVLRRLVKLRPDHGEGRLRLAVELARLGRDQRARKHFLRLIDSKQAEAWVVRLAYHELVRLVADRGRFDRAEALARAGLDRWPGDPSLRFALARIAEQRGDAKQARAWLAQVGEPPDVASSAEAMPRTHYNEWPASRFDEWRRHLVRRADERREALAAAISAMPAEP